MTRYLWNTRPQPQATRTHDYLTRHGIFVHSDAVMQIAPIPDIALFAWDKLSSYDALILTSEMALRILCTHQPHYEGCIYVVGEALARRTRDAAYPQVVAGAGSATTIPAIIAPHHQRLLYLRAEETAHNMNAMLPHKALDEWVIYHATPSPSLAPQTIQLLNEGAIRFILCTSARSVDALMHHMRHYALIPSLHTCSALCYSEAIAQQLDHNIWGTIRICDAPSDEAVQKIIR